MDNNILPLLIDDSNLIRWRSAKNGRYCYFWELKTLTLINDVCLPSYVIHKCTKCATFYLEWCTFYILTDHKLPIWQAHSQANTSPGHPSLLQIQGTWMELQTSSRRTFGNALQINQLYPCKSPTIGSWFASCPSSYSKKSHYLCQTPTSNAMYQQEHIVPLWVHHCVFDSIHSLSHPGIRATQKLVTTRYICSTWYQHWCKKAGKILPAMLKVQKYRGTQLLLWGTSQHWMLDSTTSIQTWRELGYHREVLPTYPLVIIIPLAGLKHF